MIDFIKKHYDWLIHFLLCFMAIYFKQATILATIFVAGMIEYEQWKYSQQPFTWKYFKEKMLGDLIADGFGILIGFII